MGAIHSKDLYMEVFLNRRTLCHKAKKFKKAGGSTHLRIQL